MRPEVNNWWKQGIEDLDTAEKMTKLKKYSDASFYSQQAVEKALKALFIKIKKDMPPRTHSLVELGRALKISGKLLSNMKDLNPEYVVSRYPDAAYGVPSELYTEERAKTNIGKAKEVIEWIQKKIQE